MMGGGIKRRKHRDEGSALVDEPTGALGIPHATSEANQIGQSLARFLRGETKVKPAHIIEKLYTHAYGAYDKNNPANFSLSPPYTENPLAFVLQ